MSVPTAIQQLAKREAPAESAADDEWEDCLEPSAKRARGSAEAPILVLSRWLRSGGTDKAEKQVAEGR